MEFDVSRVEQGDGFGGAGLELIAKSDDADQDVGSGDVDRGVVVLVLVGELDVERVHEPSVSDGDSLALDGCGGSAAGVVLEVGCVEQLDCVVVGVCGDGGCEGVLGVLLDGGGELDELQIVDVSVKRRNLADLVSAGGEGAGFVPDDGVDLAGGFERFGVAEEDAESCGATGSGGDGGGRGESERAGAGDDEDGDGGKDGGGPAGGVGIGEDCPADEGDDGDGDDDRDEDAGDAVRESLNGRFGRLGALDGGGDFGEGGGAADLGGLVGDGAVDVDGAGEDGVAGGLGDGQALAGEDGFVEGAGAVEDDAVDGGLLAGSEADGVADVDVGGGDVAFEAVLDDPRRLGGELEQSGKCGGGSELDAGFEGAAESDETDDDQGGVEEDVAGGAGGLERGGEEGGDGAVAPGGGDADDDQGVHVGGASGGGEGGASEHGPDAPEEGRRGDGELDGEEEVGVPAEAGPSVGLHGEKDAPADEQRGRGSAEHWE